MPKIISEEAKKNAITSLNNGDSPADICRQYHISRSTLYKWKQDYSIITLTEISSRELYLLQNRASKLEMENSIYQGILSNLSLGLDTMAGVVDVLKNEYSIYSICRLIGLNKSTYLNREKSKAIPKMQDTEDAVLGEKISIIFQKSEFRFGARKIRAKLLDDGYAVSEKRIIRLMRERGLKQRKPLPVNATMQRTYIYKPNIVQGDFDTSAPNLIWVSDITYVRVGTSVAYLCVIIDLFSRKVLAFSISEIIDATLVMDAFQKAYILRGRPSNLVFHSDQGTQYTSYSFRELLSRYHVRQSYSEPGHPTDNAVAESFFASLKKEQFRFNFYETLEEMEAGVTAYIDYYNDYRPHQKLQQKTPNQYEDSYYKSVK